MLTHPDRLFPVNLEIRNLAKSLYKEVKNLPIISPHGHTDPSWFANNHNFKNAAELLVIPDHYLLRMLYSQGVSMEDLGRTPSSKKANIDYRAIWKTFAENFYLFRGTPSSIWLNHVFSEIFQITKPLNLSTANEYYDLIEEKLKKDSFRPRELFKKFNIELIATTDEAYDPLHHHQKIKETWDGRIIPTFRPDRAIDPNHEEFLNTIERLNQITNEDTHTIEGLLKALKKRRLFFKKMGATATDHGPDSAFTCSLSKVKMQSILDKSLKQNHTKEEAKMFQGSMLIEMAKMSLEDNLVMQLHPGSFRNHNKNLFEKLGRDIGADIPQPTNYVKDLKPLLDEVGNEKNFKLILFTLDETRYSSELAPLAGHYPSLSLGPAWWFHDSPEGMKRFRKMTTETAGFYNTVGFNDDTRAFFSIPARHDVARRIDASFLAELVLEHRLTETEALEVLKELTYNLPKKAYNL